jgi:exodeoxyribonuclease-5
MVNLSADQKIALSALSDWHNSKKRAIYITLGGYAGTGKTTLIAEFRKKLHKEHKKLKVSFVSFTGKAAQVLKNTLVRENVLYSDDYCGTIHSLIYAPIVNDKEEIIGWERKKLVETDLIIVDEASMVDQNIWYDLLSYNVPIIAVGDHGQLPPVSGTFNLMQDPHLKLERIHRQSEGNPIIHLSMLARTEGHIPAGNFAAHIKKFDKTAPESQEEIQELLSAYTPDTIVACGYNHTRVKLNAFIRRALEIEGFAPKAKDRVICLRNNHIAQIYNGMIGTLQQVYEEDKDWYFGEVEFDDGTSFEGLMLKRQFGEVQPINHTRDRQQTLKGDLFDFGYAMTVHKVQGSQAKRVILFEERFPRMDDEMWRRWLYTGITRAQEELYLIG